MSEEKRRPWVTSESWRLAFSIACTIRNSRTAEKAVEDICGTLQAWDVEVSPDELGSTADRFEAILRFYADGRDIDPSFEPD